MHSVVLHQDISSASGSTLSIKDISTHKFEVYNDRQCLGVELLLWVATFQYLGLPTETRERAGGEGRFIMGYGTG